MLESDTQQEKTHLLTASLGLKKTPCLTLTKQMLEGLPDETEKMLARNFYVDDLLISQPTEEQALETIKEGIRRLKRYYLNLSKVQSN